MKRNYPHTSLGVICGLFGKTRQGWYAQNRQAEQTKLQHAVVLELVREIRNTQPGAGTPTLYKMLRPVLPGHHIKMGRAALNDSAFRAWHAGQKEAQKAKDHGFSSLVSQI